MLRVPLYYSSLFSSCVRRIRVNTGCVLRTRLHNVRRCYCVYGPTLTEVVRAGRAGTRVPARLRRTSVDYRPISARLLATFTVARTLHRRVPHTCAAQTRCFVSYSLDVFHLHRFHFFSLPTCVRSILRQCHFFKGIFYDIVLQYPVIRICSFEVSIRDVV